MKDVINLIGPPGSGKSGVREGIVTGIPGCRVVPMSDELLAMKDDPVVGPIIEDTTSRGCLTPSEIVIPLFEMVWLSMNHGVDESCIVLDGVIRTLPQLHHLFDLAHNGDYGYRVVTVFLDTDLLECERRMLGRCRVDDNPGSIARRFVYYKAFTLPILEYLKRFGNEVITINGNQPIEGVQTEVRQKLRL